MTDHTRKTTPLSRFGAVVITGGSSGIGEAFIASAGKLEPSLPICNLSRSKPRENLTPAPLFHLPCDLSQPAALAEAAAEVSRTCKKQARPGPILLINNSGFGGYGPFPHPNTDHHLTMIDVNVRACVHLTGLLLPMLRERGGVIVNVASTAAFQPTPYMAVYGATKSFLLNWSLALDEDLRGSGVRSLALCPGPTSTNFFRMAGFREPPMAGGGHTSEQVIEVLLRALENEKRIIVPGLQNKLTAMIASRLPKSLGTRLTALILKKMRLDSFLSGQSRP